MSAITAASAFATLTDSMNTKQMKGENQHSDGGNQAFVSVENYN